MSFFVHASSVIDENVQIGEDTQIWHFCHVQSGASIGRACRLGQNVYIGSHVQIGSGCKLQNNVSVYAGVTLEDGVFCGPSCVFTNDMTPRAQFPKGHENYMRTLVKEGASIGANATIVCGHTLGRYAMVGAGAVVTSDVPDHVLMLGVPAKPVGFVCTCGERLHELSCATCGRTFEHNGLGLKEVK